MLMTRWRSWTEPTSVTQRNCFGEPRPWCDDETRARNKARNKDYPPKERTPQYKKINKWKSLAIYLMVLWPYAPHRCCLGNRNRKVFVGFDVFFPLPWREQQVLEETPRRRSRGRAGRIEISVRTRPRFPSTAWRSADCWVCQNSSGEFHWENSLPGLSLERSVKGAQSIHLMSWTQDAGGKKKKEN